MSDQIEIQARIVNETDTGYCVTQRRFGSVTGCWLPKDKVTVADRHAIQPHHIITLPADMAARHGLGPKMQESRPAPSPYGAET